MLQRVCILPHQRWPLPHLSGSASTVSAGLSDAGAATRPWGVPYTATSNSARNEVRCCAKYWWNPWNETTQIERVSLIHCQLNYWFRTKDDGFLIRTTQVSRNEDDNICEIYPRLIAGGFEADRCRCRVMHPTCIVLVCLKKQRKLVKLKKMSATQLNRWRVSSEFPI